MITKSLRHLAGFTDCFTRENIARLTHAAGVEEELLELQARVGNNMSRQGGWRPGHTGQEPVHHWNGEST